MKDTREELAVGKIVAAGSNYADHAKEMGTPRPKEPTLFLKPSTSILHVGEPIVFPEVGSMLHHEVELGLLIGRTCKNVSVERAHEHVLGYLLALDLTLRDLQQDAKKHGRPWATSKGFDCACPVSDVLPLSDMGLLGSLELTLSVNGENRQHGSTSDMIWSPPELVAVASRYFTLERGDILLTGTPAGVGPLERGDRVEAWLGSDLAIGFDVV
ncbi:fumarylacetoacetate hydrolase family protein [bacterium]|nr:fumarylacetoacetate hydrolase family protein [bacterium]